MNGVAEGQKEIEPGMSFHFQMELLFKKSERTHNEDAYCEMGGTEVESLSTFLFISCLR